EMQQLQLNADVCHEFYHHKAIRQQPATVLDVCGTLLLARGATLAAEEAQVRAFLERGGNLIVVGRIAEEALKQWPTLFGEGVRYGGVLGPGTVIHDHPLTPTRQTSLLDDLEITVGLAEDTTVDWPEL